MSISLKEVYNNNPYCITKSEDLDTFYVNKIFAKEEWDYYTPLKNGKEWLYELTLKHQPKTGEILLNGGELMLFSRQKDQSCEYYSPMLLQEVNGRMIEIFREFHNRNQSDTHYKQIDDRETCLPEPLRAAYYHRFSGLSVLWEPRSSILSANLLPPNLVNWSSIDRYLGQIRQKKKHLSWIEEIFPGIIHRDRHGLRSFLNIWHSKKEADILFAKTHIQDGIIYYIKDHDVRNMMIISNPVEAMDGYCAHVLLRKQGRFDFMPYTSKMNV